MKKKLGMILTIFFLFSAKMIQQWTELDGLMSLKGQKWMATKFVTPTE